MQASITAFFLALSSNNYLDIPIKVVLLLDCLAYMAPPILLTAPILLPVVTKSGVASAMLD
jgi:TRAP-type C4-dicarboxylate transport system permease large subunit